MNLPRDRMLGRVGEAAQRGRLPATPPSLDPLPPPGSPSSSTTGEHVARFVAELTALSGHAYTGPDAESAVSAIETIVAGVRSRRMLSWGRAELPDPLVADLLEERGFELVHLVAPAAVSDRTETLARLDPIEVGLTGAVAGLADTGSIVVTSGHQRPRLASLLPPVHIALLSRRAILQSLGAYLRSLGRAPLLPANLVVITGPSRTADIEMTLTHGVHGPRELHVILLP